MIIKDTAQTFEKKIICEKSEKSSIIREKICKEIEGLNKDNFFFIFNGDKLDEKKTIEENGIKMNNIILLIKINLTVIFKDQDGKSKYELKIDFNKKFSELIKELNTKKLDLKKAKYDFLFNSKKLNSNLAIIENGINDKEFIFINKCLPFSSKIKVRIQDSSQNINEIIECEKNDMSSVLRKKIIDKKPELKNINFYFVVNGNKLDEEKTIKENKIGNGDYILLIKNNESMPNNNFSNKIAIIIRSSDPQFEIPFACKRSYRFSAILEKLYKQKPECRDQNKELTKEGKDIDPYLTLEENDIKDGDIIDYKKKEEEREEVEDPNEISVIFRNARFKYPLICNKKDIFKDLKKKFLIKKQYKNKNVYFIANGNVIDTMKSIEENNIKDSDNIFVNDY